MKVDAAHNLVPVGNHEQRDVGVVGGACPLLDLLTAFVLRLSFGRETFSQHGIDGVAHGDDARAQGNVGAGQAIGIAPTIPALVVMAHDEGDGLQACAAPQNLGAHTRMVAQHGVLLGGPAPLLEQDGIGNGNLADVVDVSRHVNGHHLLGRQAHGQAGLLHHVAHTQRMLGSMRVARLERRDDALHEVVQQLGRCAQVQTSIHLALLPTRLWKQRVAHFSNLFLT